MKLFDIIDNWRIIKKIAFVPILILIACFIGFFLLALVYCIPTNIMEKNMYKSAEVMGKLDLYQDINGYTNSVLDSCTDSLMLLIASHPNTENAFIEAMNNSNYNIQGNNPYYTLLYLYSPHDNSNLEFQSNNYARYWHGYLVFLKPLLAIGNYAAIRSIIMLLQLILFIILILEIYKVNKKMVLPTCIMYIFLNPVIVMSSIQFNNIVMITFIAMLAVIFLNKKIGRKSLYLYGLLFLIIGIVSSFIDLLTYPLITLGVPIILYLSLNYSDNIFDSIKPIIMLSFFWLIGYLFMWAAKWILGSIITGENIINNAISQIEFRTSSSFENNSFNYLQVLTRNIKASYQPGWVICLLVLVISYVIDIIKYRKIDLKILIPFSLIGLYPFVWYAVLKNHSYIHYWFTYRELTILIYAISSFIMLCKPLKKSNKERLLPK